MTVRSLVEAFLTAKAAANRAPRTLEFYDQHLTHFANWLEQEGGTPCPQEVERYLAALRAVGTGPATVAARYRALLAWANWCERRKLIVPNALAGVERPRTPRRSKKTATAEDLAALLASIPQGGPGTTWLEARDRLLLQVLFFCGLRLGELVGLRVEDVDLTARRLYIRRQKGGGDRMVPFPPALRPAFLEYLYTRPMGLDALWLAADGYGGTVGPLTGEGVRQMIKRRSARARVRYLHPHAWRHGFATALNNAGARMGTISKLMGHSDEAVTRQVYAEYTVEGLQSEYDEVVARLCQKNG